MKRMLTLFVAMVFAITITHAQTGWVDHKGDNRISVKFPSDPKEAVAGSFIAFDKDSTVYVFTLVDFVKVAGIDSTVLAPIKNSPEFTAQLKTGMGQSLPGVTLDDFKIGTWKGFNTYSSTGIDSKKKHYDIWMILIGNNMYSFSTVRADGIGTQGRDIFFGSVTLSN